MLHINFNLLGLSESLSICRTNKAADGQCNFARDKYQTSISDMPYNIATFIKRVRATRV
jgi:hypothetical protein